MDKDFWLSRWTLGEIGFHRAAPNELLRAHAAELDGFRRVYAPLCGKSLDLRFLRDLGHEVLGTELSPIAIEAFFREAGLTARVSQRGPYRVHEADGYTILEGDALVIQPEHLGGRVDAIYDRGSLVALDPSTQRAALAASFGRVLRPGGRVLVVAFDYDQSKLPGPPWSIARADLDTLFASVGEVREVAARDEAVGPRMSAAGIESITERLFAIG